MPRWWRSGRRDVDLQTLASLGQPDASVTVGVSSTDAAVTYLDLTTHE